MNIELVGNLFMFAGGIGMFLYGMNIMADGMQKSAGSKMKQLIGYLTRNRLLAVLVGAFITAIIQSSGATTVMVVGFVNAGLMTLVQAVGVIMGANIGTTITSMDCIFRTARRCCQSVKAIILCTSACRNRCNSCIV